MGLPRPTMIVIGALLLLFLSWWLATWANDPCGERRIYLDSADGLRVGDGVYAAGDRIGSVKRVQPHGRRMAIDLYLRCTAAPSLNPHTTFFLDRDPEDAQHFCLRALSHGTPTHGKEPAKTSNETTRHINKKQSYGDRVLTP